jgi:hypothetical protein
MSVLSYACPTVGCYQNYPCDPEYMNKIIAVAFVKKSAGIGSTLKDDPQGWMDTFMQLYLDGDAYLIFNTSGDKPKPETATTTGRGMLTTKTLAKTHTLNYMDLQGVTLTNVQWYCDMLSSSQNYDFYYFTPGRIWDASGQYVTVIGDPVITGELNTYQQAEVVVTWTSKCNPLPYDFPTDTFNAGLFFVVEGPSGAIPQDSFTTCQTSTVTPNWVAVLNYESPLDEGTLTWSIQANETAVPDGLTIDTEPELNLNNVATGTYSLTVVVTNQSGCVFGSLDFTLVVEECGG